MEQVSLFPTEVNNLILEFQGYHKCRNGKYMKQINCNDEKYDSIRKKTWNQCYYKNDYGRFYRTIFYKKIENVDYKIMIHSINYGGKLHWYMNVLVFHQISNQNIVWKKCKDKSVHYIYEN